MSLTVGFHIPIKVAFVHENELPMLYIEVDMVLSQVIFSFSTAQFQKRFHVEMQRYEANCSTL